MFRKSFFFFKLNAGIYMYSFYMFFSPLFQPVKIFLSLDSAILSINNPSGFVSTANLISTSSILLHPSCRKNGWGDKVKGWALGYCWRCLQGWPWGLITASTAPVPAGRPRSAWLFRVSEALTSVLLESSHHVLCQKHFCVPPVLVVSSGQEFCWAWAILGELTLAPRDRCFLFI